MSNKIYFLIDCNACFCSIETSFRPDLLGRPVVVLSNNDGSIIARNALAKRLTKMGQPYFQVRGLLRQHGAAVFSSNFELYGDMSRRVMEILQIELGDVTPYSIDEAFADLSSYSGDLLALANRTQANVLRCTGIGTGIGISSTYTLAKLASYAAKRWTKTNGIVDLTDSERAERLMKITPVQEVWGVGRKYLSSLNKIGIQTAWDLANANPVIIAKRFSVVLERTVLELNGISAIRLDSVSKEKQQICVSKSFGEKQINLNVVSTALAQYVAIAHRRLTGQQSECGRIKVFLTTGSHSNERFYNSAELAIKPYTDSLSLLTKAAISTLERIWLNGYQFSKVGVIFNDLRSISVTTPDLFLTNQQNNNEALKRLIVESASKYGAGALKTARSISTLNKTWKPRAQYKSPCYTTNISELLVVQCR